MDETTMKYLQMVKELESTRLVCEKSVAELDAKVATLGVPCTLAKPERTVVAADGTCSAEDPVAGGVFGGIMGGIAWPFVGYCLSEAGLLSGIDAPFLLLPVTVAIGAAVGGIYMASQAREDAAKKQEEMDAEYKSRMQEYRWRAAKDEQRVRRERAQMAGYKAERATLAKKSAETSKLLAKAYGANVIHPKYRTLPAVCTIFDYFDTGICNRFDGPDGAYARYENDARMDRICTSLESIDRKMSVIIANQFSLNRSIQETNEQVRSLGSAMDRYADRCADSMRQVTDAVNDAKRYVVDIRQDSAATSWSAEQTRRELAYSRWLNNRYDLRGYL